MSEDLIRRSDAVEMLQEAIMAYPPVMKGCGETRDSTLEEAISLILDIPSADRPKGEWIGEADGYADGEFVYDTWYCSNCDYAVDDEPPTWDYCPNCGARMKGASDGNK